MSTTMKAETFNHESLSALRARFLSLPPLDRIAPGIYRAEFIGPAWMCKAAPGILLLGGLGGWWGKEFYGEGHGVNLVYRRGQFQRLFPMRVVPGPSRLDGQTGLSIQYTRDCPLPWPYMIDELRCLNETSVFAMTLVNVGPLHRLAFPFLLHAREQLDG